MASPVVLRVHEGTVMAYALPGGEVSDLVWAVARMTREIAKQTAPQRTGRLRRGIGANRPKPLAPYHTASEVYANARHALWVHEGTTGPIMPKKSFTLVVPRERGPASGSELYSASGGDGGVIFFTRGVRGQRPQPFLANAMRQALAIERLT